MTETFTAVPILRINGLYFVDVEVGPPVEHCEVAASELYEAASSTVAADEMAMLWAARMNADSDGLLKIARATTGIPVAKIHKRTQWN